MPGPNLSPPARFLLRGSAFVAVLLTVWWLVPWSPLLAGLRTSAEIGGALLFNGDSPFRITETSKGDWTFKVPLHATLPPTHENPEAQSIHSLDFDLVRSDASAFTFGLPVFWAIMLAAPHLRGNLRPLLLGTVVMGALEVALVLITAQTLAHKTLAQLQQSQDPMRAWFLKFSEYLAVNAIPYLLPFAVAIWMHGELREQIFHWATTPAATPPASRSRKKKTKS